MNNMNFGNIQNIKDHILDKLAEAIPAGKLKSILAPFASAFTQNNRLLTLQIGDSVEFDYLMLPQCAQGTESLSACYQFEVTCLSPDAFIALEGLLGQAAALSILTGAGGLLDFDEAPQEVTRCGLITRAQALSSDGGLARYKLTIEPPLALLRHRRTSRVFQDMSVPEIVRQVLVEHIDSNKAIGRTLNLKPDLIQPHLHTPRSYCLQHRESDLAFIERLLFEEGIGYRFEHQGGQTPAVSFIMFDTTLRLPQASQKSVRFHRAGATEKEDSLTEWTQSRQIGPRRASLSTYDYKPAQTTETGNNSRLEQGEGGILAEASLEEFDAQTLYYGTDFDALSHYARRRQEARDMQKGCYRAQGNVRQLKAGEWFSLANHPSFDRFEYQGEKEFVVCSLTRKFHQKGIGSVYFRV
jgi:type VI secretion system secreted protein VgrG